MLVFCLFLPVLPCCTWPCRLVAVRKHPTCGAKDALMSTYTCLTALSGQNYPKNVAHPTPLSQEHKMKKLIAALLLSLPFAAAPAFAADDAKPTAQQNKMGTCNAEAKGKTGDERKAFMKECLKGKSDGRKAQNQKMKTCNAEAKGKSGPERKAFMKECLSK
jgi:hypothetical protein